MGIKHSDLQPVFWQQERNNNHSTGVWFLSGMLPVESVWVYGENLDNGSACKIIKYKTSSAAVEWNVASREEEAS